MHLAAAAGVPVTAIFGPTNERATALGEHDVLLEPVFCRPCMLRECPIDHRCMKRISGRGVRVGRAAPVRRAVFLDRDGTLLEEGNYVDRLDRLVFFPHTPSTPFARSTTRISPW